MNLCDYRETEKIKCYKCGHEWEYKGTSIYFVCCPSCRNQLSRKKLGRIRDEDEDGRKRIRNEDEDGRKRIRNEDEDGRLEKSQSPSPSQSLKYGGK